MPAQMDIEERDCEPVDSDVSRERYTSFYGEIQFFFTAKLPAELSLPNDIVLPNEYDDDEDLSGVTIQALACVRKMRVQKDKAGLLRRVQGVGALAVIHVKWIRDIIGLVKVGAEEYVVKRWNTLDMAV